MDALVEPRRSTSAPPRFGDRPCPAARVPTTPNRFRRHRTALAGALLLLAPLTHPAGAQVPRAFALFLDCSGFYCEPDFYRADLVFVDHVRERQAADVHVLATREPTGGGGMAYVLTFYGQRRFNKGAPG